MLNEKEAVEKELLLLLHDSTQPVGCGSLCAALQARGFRIREAPPGRLLRAFALHSEPEKAGYQGRSLSNAGEARLQELLQVERRQQWREELTSAVQGHTKEELLEVLVARDAIEGALAALAAQKATPTDVVALTNVLTRQQLRAETDQVAADEDVAFHEELARIAGNKILRASIGLIRQDHQLSPVLETIRRRVGSKIHIDHQRIVDAIRAQDPEAAKAAMHQHIIGLIHDVEKYWDES